MWINSKQRVEPYLGLTCLDARLETGCAARKGETQRNRRGPAQAVEDVVQFEATRRTLPGLDMLVVLNRKVMDSAFGGEPAQVLHGCRQLVP